MPLFEYVCRTCHKDFELLVSASQRDTPQQACPACGEHKIARKISLMAKPVVRSGGTEAPAYDCGASGGCCGGACGLGS